MDFIDSNTAVVYFLREIMNSDNVAAKRVYLSLNLRKKVDVQKALVNALDDLSERERRAFLTDDSRVYYDWADKQRPKLDVYAKHGVYRDQIKKLLTDILINFT